MFIGNWPGFYPLFLQMVDNPIWGRPANAAIHVQLLEALARWPPFSEPSANASNRYYRVKSSRKIILKVSFHVFSMANLWFRFQIFPHHFRHLFFNPSNPSCHMSRLEAAPGAGRFRAAGAALSEVGPLQRHL